MKIKTSVSISERALAKIKRIAAAQERSVSWILEKFIEEKAAQLPEQKKTRGRAAGINASLILNYATTVASMGIAAYYCLFVDQLT